MSPIEESQKPTARSRPDELGKPATQSRARVLEERVISGDVSGAAGGDESSESLPAKKRGWKHYAGIAGLLVLVLILVAELFRQNVVEDQVVVAPPRPAGESVAAPSPVAETGGSKAPQAVKPSVILPMHGGRQLVDASGHIRPEFTRVGVVGPGGKIIYVSPDDPRAQEDAEGARQEGAVPPPVPSHQGAQGFGPGGMLPVAAQATATGSGS